MKIISTNYALPVSKRLISILETEIRKARIKGNKKLNIRFRDSTFSAQTGGYLPVEIAISAEGLIRYITDFSYVSTTPFEELAIELDFDFEHSTFQQFKAVYPITQAREIFTIWQNNFCTYYKNGSYDLVAVDKETV